jgi:hypothetical protein
VAGKEQAMEKHIMRENGISYTLGADGLYYPDLTLPKGTDYPIGRYGRMRADYLREHYHSMYMKWFLQDNGMNICMRLTRNATRGLSF